MSFLIYFLDDFCWTACGYAVVRQVVSHTTVGCNNYAVAYFHAR